MLPRLSNLIHALTRTYFTRPTYAINVIYGGLPLQIYGMLVSNL